VEVDVLVGYQGAVMFRDKQHDMEIAK